MHINTATIFALLAVGLMTSDYDVNACEKACPNVYIAAQGICSSDGKIYTDLCYARCYQEFASELFICKFPFDETERKRCAEECAKVAHDLKQCKNNDNLPIEFDDSTVHKCIEKCPVWSKPTLICGSNGLVYLDECYAKCIDKDITQEFGCSEHGEFDCSEKCGAAFRAKDCSEKCPLLLGQNQICATDGNLYAGECRAKCTDSQNVSLFSCGSLCESDCKKECIRQKSILQCQNDCPKYKKRLMYWCANNGKVYDDLCKAQCIDKSIEFVFNCEDKGISTAEKDKCEKICSPQQSCEKQCHDQKTKYVCASDGQIYKNKCLALCNNLKVLFSVRRPDLKQKKRCQSKVLMVGSVLE